MAIYKDYRCPDCKGTFTFLHHPNNEPPPDHCHLCGSYMGEAPEQAPTVINIATAKGKVGDKLYRQMEAATEARIEAAAEMTGGDKSDFAHMKMTDMKDNQREGDITAPSVTKSMDNLTNNVNGRKVAPEMQSMTAREFIPQTTAGPQALTTRKVLSQMPHREIAARHTAAGNMGSHK